MKKNRKIDKAISVAMTTYNGSGYVVEQLQSIYNQSQKVDEVIICDDQSTDNTVKLVNDFITLYNLQSWKIVVNDKRLGFSDNFWKATSLCSGEVIFLSDQDDIWYPSKVKDTMAIMHQDATINLVSSSYDICDSDGKVVLLPVRYARSYDDSSIEDIELAELMGRSTIRGCSMSFKSSILKNEQLVSLSSGLGHDWLITCLAAVKGRPVYYNKKLFKYRIHTNNASLQRANYTWRGLHAMVKKRVRQTQEERQALETLLSRTDLTKQASIILNQQYVFVSNRSDLVRNSNLRQIFPLALSIGMYSGSCQSVNLRGLRHYAADIICALHRRIIGNRHYAEGSPNEEKH